MQYSIHKADIQWRWFFPTFLAVVLHMRSKSNLLIKHFSKKLKDYRKTKARFGTSKVSLYKSNRSSFTTSNFQQFTLKKWFSTFLAVVFLYLQMRSESNLRINHFSKKGWKFTENKDKIGYIYVKYVQIQQKLPPRQQIFNN